MFFLLEVIRYLTVLAVYSGFGAHLQVVVKVAVRDHAATLAGDFPVWTRSEVLQSIVIHQTDLVCSVIQVCVVWTLELLLLQFLFRKPVDRKEFCVCASDRTLCMIFVRLLINPLLNAFPTKRRLTFLAL